MTALWLWPILSFLAAGVLTVTRPSDRQERRAR